MFSPFLIIFMKKPFVVFIIVGLFINTFIYFYPADIFQIDINNVFKESTLKDIISSNLYSYLTIKGWLMLIICSVGIPIIIAWRSTLTKYDRKTGDKKKSIFDKLN